MSAHVQRAALEDKDLDGQPEDKARAEEEREENGTEDTAAYGVQSVAVAALLGAAQHRAAARGSRHCSLSLSLGLLCVQRLYRSVQCARRRCELLLLLLRCRPSDFL